MFEIGRTVLLQEVWNGHVWSARPAVVALDRPDLTALWMPEGTRWFAPTTPPDRVAAPTRGERLSECLARSRATGEREWAYREMSWDVSTLWLWWAGRRSAVWVSWIGDFEPLGWYVNLQEPFLRTARGFHWMDQTLDIVIQPDCEAWRWKDEDELAVFVERGIYTAEEAGRIRAEGQAVLAALASRQPPFDHPWHEWRPDPAWPLPRLSDGWDRP